MQPLDHDQSLEPARAERSRQKRAAHAAAPELEQRLVGADGRRQPASERMETFAHQNRPPSAPTAPRRVGTRAALAFPPPQSTSEIPIQAVIMRRRVRRRPAEVAAPHPRAHVVALDRGIVGGQIALLR